MVLEFGSTNKFLFSVGFLLSETERFLTVPKGSVKFHLPPPDGLPSLVDCPAYKVPFLVWLAILLWFFLFVLNV